MRTPRGAAAVSNRLWKKMKTSGAIHVCTGKYQGGMQETVSGAGAAWGRKKFEKWGGGRGGTRRELRTAVSPYGLVLWFWVWVGREQKAVRVCVHLGGGRWDVASELGNMGRGLGSGDGTNGWYGYTPRTAARAAGGAGAAGKGDVSATLLCALFRRAGKRNCTLSGWVVGWVGSEDRWGWRGARKCSVWGATRATQKGGCGVWKRQRHGCAAWHCKRLCMGAEVCGRHYV